MHVMKIDRRIRTEGCVLTALESAFKVKTSPAERKLRLSQLDTLSKVIDHCVPPDLTEEEEIIFRRIVIASEIKLYEELLAQIRMNKTPLGNALRSHNYEQRFMTESQLVQLLTRRGPKVIGHMQFFHSGHAAHLGIAGGRIVMISDHNARVPQKRLTPNFRVDVFTQK